MRGTEGHRKGWGTGLAASVGLAVAIIILGTVLPAQAAPLAYVTTGGNDSATAIAGSDFSDTPIAVGNTPMYLAATPDGTRVYVPNRYTPPVSPARASVGVKSLYGNGNGNVSVIDTETNTVITTIDNASFNEPYAVAVSPDGTRAWVINHGDGSIVIIDTSTNMVVGVRNTPCGEIGKGVVFNPDQEAHPEAYIVTGSTDGDTVCGVSTSVPYDTTFTLFPENFGEYVMGEYAVVTPDGAKIFVTGSQVLIIETALRNYRGIPPSSFSTVSYLAVSNDGNKIYAAGGGAYENYLEIIDSSHADFNDDDFTDTYVDFPGANSINAVAVLLPGTNLGLVTGLLDIGEGPRLWAFDTRDGYDNVITSDALPVILTGSPVAIVAIGGESAPPPPPPTPGPTPSLDLQRDGLGAGWFSGSCGMVVGRDGKGPMSGAESAGMIALYFALLLLPVGILKLVHGRKRRPFEKGGIVALLIIASMLVASAAQAERIIAPKAQRFHPTTDGSGALTVDSDETIGLQKFGYGLMLNGAKKPLDMGNIRELTIEKVVVDELYTADLTAAYGITKDISLGLDIPYEYSRDNLNYADYLKNGAPGVRDDVFHLGDIRVNAKFRVIDGKGYGLAFIPFANFATGDRDYLLSEGKFGFGMKAAAHYDVTKPLTLYANLGAEHIGPIATPSSAAGYYAPWIQYGVGAKYLLPGRNHSVVAEVNGETSMSTPYAHTTLSPLEVLAAYRTEVAPGWTLQAGGGGGLNKGMGAPQWRAFLGIARVINFAKPAPPPAPVAPPPAPAPAPVVAPPPPPPAPAAPVVSLSANPPAVDAGKCTTLNWASENADGASIDQGVGTVPPNGSKSVCPDATKPYTVTATGPGGSRTAATTVTVHPPPPPPAVKPVKEVIHLQVQFDTAKADVKSKYNADLQRVADYMKKYPETTVTIEGNTDNVGGKKYNQKLSERRAASVKDYLVKKLGVDASKISSVGYGLTRPVADNKTPQGKQQNRRVDAVFR